MYVFNSGTTWAHVGRTPSILPMCELFIEAVGSCADFFVYAGKIAEKARAAFLVALITSFFLFFKGLNFA